MSFNLFLSTSFSFSFLELPVSVKMGVPVGSQLHVVEILTSSFAPIFCSHINIRCSDFRPSHGVNARTSHRGLNWHIFLLIWIQTLTVCDVTCTDLQVPAFGRPAE